MNKATKAINKAKKQVRKDTIHKIAATGDEVLKELRNEKWRYRALMAIWLICPNFSKRPYKNGQEK